MRPFPKGRAAPWSFPVPVPPVSLLIFIMLPLYSALCSSPVAERPPFLSMRGGQTVISPIVDSTPTEHSPPSTTHSNPAVEHLYDVKRVFRLFRRTCWPTAQQAVLPPPLLSQASSHVPDNAHRRCLAPPSPHPARHPFLFKDHRQRTGPEFFRQNARRLRYVFRKCFRRRDIRNEQIYWLPFGPALDLIYPFDGGFIKPVRRKAVNGLCRHGAKPAVFYYLGGF